MWPPDWLGEVRDVSGSLSYIKSVGATISRVTRHGGQVDRFLNIDRVPHARRSRVATGSQIRAWRAREAHSAKIGPGVVGASAGRDRFRWFNDQHSKYYVAVWFEASATSDRRLTNASRSSITSRLGGQYSE
jgi:hypothetical protein